MQNNHYGEHTIQQDGWTVLAPPANPEPPRLPENPGLPPPYTPEAPQVAHAPVATAPVPHAAVNEGTQLMFDVPTDANIIGAKETTRAKKYGRGFPFHTAFIQMCDAMGLHPSTAQIGYKWDNEKAVAPLHALVTSEDWNDCLESGIGQTERARIRKVRCLIQNLNPPENTAAVATKGKKHKAGEESASSSNGRSTFDFTDQHPELKRHLSCTTHKNSYCWVRDAKRMRRTQHTVPAAPANQNMPAIHVTVNTGGAPASPRTRSSPTRAPLGTITAAAENTANITCLAFSDSPFSGPAFPGTSSSVDLRTFGDENFGHSLPSGSVRDNSGSMRYPSVTDILQAIDDSGDFAESTALQFPVVIFADYLHECEITRADQVPVVEAQFYVDQIHMPIELAEHFVAEAIAAIEHTHKGKGKALL
ncbi:hypothetical protein B0H16DRAFT_1738903 [Mycena metata]|uniref:Uncharacterized protein n=1 Tax=Mycena metata TaxID=1033252 RepID=A0AAD7HHR2_9AGAR|nr:hypothetical protein B0H16DRAFT_1738903 [Mycena metata]